MTRNDMIPDPALHPATTLLQLNSSLFGQGGHSSQLAGQFVARWQSQNPDGQVVVRDLASTPVPHLTAETVIAFQKKPEERNAAEQAAVDASDRLIDELRAASVIVIGAPMYNFGIPSTLKAYLDQVVRAGVTFSYTANGPRGYLTGKKVVVFATRGGDHAGTPLETMTPYLRQVLGFIGLDDVEVVYAEGIARGRKDAAMQAASQRIDQLIPEHLSRAA
jgi:FMN-dependent NADH-azoreductase